MTAAQPAERRLIVLLSVGAFGSAASLRVTDAQLPALAQTFDIGLAGAAQAITVFSVAYGLMQLLYGPLGDRDADPAHCQRDDRRAKAAGPRARRQQRAEAGGQRAQRRGHAGAGHR
ncbi:MAG: hypothetical protein ACK6DI_08350, partial [Betaproteobacteria bacterium]